MADVFRTKDYLTGTSFVTNGVKAITAQRLRDFVVTVTPSVQIKTTDYQMNADTDSVILANHATTPLTITLENYQNAHNVAFEGLLKLEQAIDTLYDQNSSTFKHPTIETSLTDQEKAFVKQLGQLCVTIKNALVQIDPS